ncbi:VLRF1 family aeRF1-type release factor [Rossellomorea aquimaris]|uniref:Uncharacterized protein n=1 Tax=Rossellomorea aquimaris TaxID=189382 RepID=A0A1J6W6A7_9BACI|nr:VLRF1 family aeRF1-type release factor [Rossellomorea aquimaris]OIU73122.1 hypothetical protein BHE18_00155 [Rossellomorea aquimaris]
MLIFIDCFYSFFFFKIEKLKKERRWEEIHIIGEAEHAQSFAKVLHQKPNSCIHKNFINNSADKILHEVFEK